MRRGFTLIELLIVIAIIAILALIAVPNFLEAQTRAKVSRLYADMRAIAVAIEAYTVDWGRPPIGRNEGGAMDLWNPTSQEANGAPYAFLTTPVAFMTSPPHDPFARHGFTKTNTGKRETLPYFEYKVSRGLWRSDLQPSSGSKHWEVWGNGYIWWCHSPGPSMKFGSPWPSDMFSKLEPPTNIYDASNGTISYGQITRSNKGVYTGNND